VTLSPDQLGAIDEVLRPALTVMAESS